VRFGKVRNVTSTDGADPAGMLLEAGKPAPRFSVIMNVYNGDAFVAEAIDSVIAQVCADWELIIWDDCSTDRTGEICRAYGDARIRYFRGPQNTGVGAARNMAVRQAGGEWLAFLDQDDIWLPHKLAVQNALIEQDGSGDLGLIYGRTARFDRHGRTSAFDRWHGPARLPEGDIFTDLLRKPSFIAFSSALIRRDAFLELGRIPPDTVYCPDYYLCVAIARRYRAACVQELCCLYRVHPSSMSHVYRKQIHEEALRIIENAAGPAHAHILRTRRRVHQTWIGVEEIYAGAWRSGALRILGKGSLPYLAFRPAVLCFRSLRHRLTWRAAKRELLRLIRAAGLLGWVDRVRFIQNQLSSHRRNARFIRDHPQFPVPPADLAFDAYNHVDWLEYADSGRDHADTYAAIIRQNAPGRALAILEWGCGPGRIVRHMRRSLVDFSLTLTGSDNNKRAVDWCRSHLPGIDFVVNGDVPPISFSDGQFDVVYSFSVLTHLSEARQIAWIDEMERLLRPGGLLICSTLGDRYRHLLTRQDEALRYDAGQIVIQRGDAEGKKWFLAIHPRRFVGQQLLHKFEDVRVTSIRAYAGNSQDLWAARKPQLPRRAIVADLQAVRT
jgi:glycosyltransferase involved in cell wall biosynthesis/SAM-dependent methyltransferase